MVVTTARLDKKSAKFTQYRKTISGNVKQPIAPRLDHVSLFSNVSSATTKSSYLMPLRDGSFSLGQGSLAEFTLYKIVFMQCYKLKKPPVQICNSFSEENKCNDIYTPLQAKYDVLDRHDVLNVFGVGFHQQCTYTFIVKRSKCNR